MRESGRHLFEVVGDEHERWSGRVAGPGGQVGDELLAAADVEARVRFVEQDDARFVHQRAREEHPLAFTGRERREAVVRELLAVEVREERVRAIAVRVGVGVPPRRERGVLRGHHDLRRRHARLERGRERGGGERDAFAQRAHVAATEALPEHVDGAPRGMLVERGDAEQRRLARTVRAEHDPSFARADRPVHVRQHGRAVELQGDVGELEGRGHGSRSVPTIR